jgi:hypothetical protein
MFDLKKWVSKSAKKSGVPVRVKKASVLRQIARRLKSR